jgi:hypothetical protein
MLPVFDVAADQLAYPRPWQYVGGLVRTRLLERIPSSLTLAGDLGKRRSAQRLALDT